MIAPFDRRAFEAASFPRWKRWLRWSLVGVVLCLAVFALLWQIVAGN